MTTLTHMKATINYPEKHRNVRTCLDIEVFFQLFNHKMSQRNERFVPVSKIIKIYVNLAKYYFS